VDVDASERTRVRDAVCGVGGLLVCLLTLLTARRAWSEMGDWGCVF
jgi:hypothetical protein